MSDIMHEGAREVLRYDPEGLLPGMRQRVTRARVSAEHSVGILLSKYPEASKPALASAVDVSRGASGFAREANYQAEQQQAVDASRQSVEAFAVPGSEITGTAQFNSQDIGPVSSSEVSLHPDVLNALSNRNRMN